VSAAESLAGYPGGDAVATAAGKVANADSEAITSAATRLTTAAGNIGTYGGEVAGGVTGLDAAWEGTSADGFVAYMGRFATAGTDVSTSMTEAATALTSAAEAIDTAKTYVSTRCEQGLTEIRNWRRDNPTIPQEVYDSVCRRVCGEVAGDIDSHLEGTEQTLASAVTAVNGAKSPATTYSGLAQPDTQPFTPQSGQPIEWIPTPPAETSPAGTDQGGQQQSGQQQSSGSSNGSSNGNGSGGSYAGPSSGGPPAGPPPGNVQEWIKQAIEVLRQNGINVSEADAQRIWQIIQHESGGNPNAINNWDSNAAKGTPSKGLMQCIDPTFDSYKLPGHGDIWNPVDNICAGVNYALSRYDSLANVPGIKATESGGGYVGY
jgi:uncharacterized protein YukE